MFDIHHSNTTFHFNGQALTTKSHTPACLISPRYFMHETHMLRQTLRGDGFGMGYYGFHHSGDGRSFQILCPGDYSLTDSQGNNVKDFPKFQGKQTSLMLSFFVGTEA